MFAKKPRYSFHYTLIRNSAKYVSYNDIKVLVADAKPICGAVDEQAELYALNGFAAKWDSKHPKKTKSWRAHQPELSTYFKHPQ
ncbi:MAG: transposase [Clostridia bacterium]|nr:transposase [Clostridia bacterium]